MQQPLRYTVEDRLLLQEEGYMIRGYPPAKQHVIMITCRPSLLWGLFQFCPRPNKGRHSQKLDAGLPPKLQWYDAVQ